MEFDAVVWYFIMLYVRMLYIVSYYKCVIYWSNLKLCTLLWYNYSFCLILFVMLYHICTFMASYFKWVESCGVGSCCNLPKLKVGLIKSNATEDLLFFFSFFYIFVFLPKLKVGLIKCNTTLDLLLIFLLYYLSFCFCCISILFCIFRCASISRIYCGRSVSQSVTHPQFRQSHNALP